jgi:AcrR family transcriptional regulator
VYPGFQPSTPGILLLIQQFVHPFLSIREAMMKEEGLDRRIIRTREAIQDAMINLIEEIGFESISIKDIAKKAQINRGTFYLHYHDKFDLLDQIEKEIIEDLKNILAREITWGFEEYLNYNKPLPVIVSIFEYIKRNARIMHAILGLKANPNFQRRMKQAIENNLEQLGLYITRTNSELTVPPEYLVSYIAAAHMGVIQVWLERGCQESSREMAVILSRLSVQGPLRTIREQSGQS